MEAVVRGLWKRDWVVLREVILEGEVHEEWRDGMGGFDRLMEWISTEEESESESKSARTA